MAMDSGVVNLTFSQSYVHLMDPNDSNYSTEDTNDGYYFYEDIEKLRVSTTWMHEPHVVPLVVIYGTVFLLGIVGNGVVIFSILGSRSSRSVTFTFMVSLALADILFLMVVIPHETLRMVLGGWPGGRIFCKISGFTEMLTAVASILNLTAVSFERYDLATYCQYMVTTHVTFSGNYVTKGSDWKSYSGAQLYFVIVMPMQSRRKCTVGNTRKVLVVVWILSIFLSAPTLYVRDTQQTTYYNNDSSVTMVFCSDHGLLDHQMIHFAIYQFLIMFVIPTGMMSFCYTVVIYVLWISGRTLVNLTSTTHSCRGRLSFREMEVGSSASSSDGTPLQCRCRKFTVRTQSNMAGVRDSIMKGRKQVIKMLITVIVIFLVCWGPKLIFRIIKYSDYGVYTWTEDHFNLQIALQCLPYVQSCLNPFIYGFMSKNFRKSVITSCNNHMISSPCRGRRSPIAELELEMKYSNGTFHTKTVRQTSSSE